MKFVCAKCRAGDHCPGDTTWCDCQHRPSPKRLPRMLLVAGLLAAGLSLAGCPAQAPASSEIEWEVEDCDAEDRAKKDVADCGPGVLRTTKAGTVNRNPVVVKPNPAKPNPVKPKVR